MNWDIVKGNWKQMRGKIICDGARRDRHLETEPGHALEQDIPENGGRQGCGPAAGWFPDFAPVSQDHCHLPPAWGWIIR